jgi:IS30 family transposase
LTLTAAYGREFGNHERIGKALNADFYFAYPYCSWERGANENSNGLVRQYFPKGSDFSNITDRDLRRVERRLNNRPRKCLNMKTPNQVAFGLAPSVALGI